MIRESERRLRTTDAPEPSHGAVVGTLAGAAPPWMETWTDPTPPSAWDDRAWVSTVHNDGLPDDRRARLLRRARVAVRAAARRRRFAPPVRVAA